MDKGGGGPGREDPEWLKELLADQFREMIGRFKQDMSQSEIAAKIGMSPPELTNRLEGAKVPKAVQFRNLYQLAIGMDIKFSTVLHELADRATLKAAANPPTLEYIWERRKGRARIAGPSEILRQAMQEPDDDAGEGDSANQERPLRPSPGASGRPSRGKEGPRRP